MGWPSHTLTETQAEAGCVSRTQTTAGGAREALESQGSRGQRFVYGTGAFCGYSWLTLELGCLHQLPAQIFTV